MLWFHQALKAETPQPKIVSPGARLNAARVRSRHVMGHWKATTSCCPLRAPILVRGSAMTTCSPGRSAMCAKRHCRSSPVRRKPRKPTRRPAAKLNRFSAIATPASASKTCSGIGGVRCGSSKLPQIRQSDQAWGKARRRSKKCWQPASVCDALERPSPDSQRYSTYTERWSSSCSTVVATPLNHRSCHPTNASTASWYLFKVRLLMPKSRSRPLPRRARRRSPASSDAYQYDCTISESQAAVRRCDWTFESGRSCGSGHQHGC